MTEIDLTNPKGAIFSDDRKYRYALWRVWRSSWPLLMVIGLNPSTADEVVDDPTIVRCEYRAMNGGFGGLLMGNLFALVSTNPAELLLNSESVGEYNNHYLECMMNLSSTQLCAWGSFAPVKNRSRDVLKTIKNPYCLGINKDGNPKHPLYIAYRVDMKPYQVTL